MTITVYSKPACVSCTATYRKLDSLGIEYQVENIYDHIDEISALGYMAAPVVIAGEDHWSGYKEERLNELATKLGVAA